MGCGKCKKETCGGCGEEPLSISEFCNPIPCETPQCSESYNAACTFYMGDPIMCGTDEVVSTGDSIESAQQKLVAYFCNAIGNISLTPGPAGADGIDGVNGISILSQSFSELTAAGSLVPVTITSADFANDGDGIEMSFTLLTDNAATGNLNILVNGVTLLVSKALIANRTENFVTVYLYKSGLDFSGHVVIQPVRYAMDQGDVITGLTVANWFSVASNTITAQITGTDVTIGNLVVKKLLKA